MVDLLFFDAICFLKQSASQINHSVHGQVAAAKIS